MGSTALAAMREAAVGQFIRYVVSGGLATLAHLAVLALLVELAGMPAAASTALGFVVGSVLNYILQHLWVFQSEGAHGRQLRRYATVTFLTFWLNVALFALLHDVLGLWYLLSQVVATGVVFVVNFLINRAYTFDARGAALERRSG